jgi:endonuclease YncB( thermonuclease family)
MRCFRTILFFLLLAIPATCLSWPAKVFSVVDGDTIIVLHNGQQKEIRLYGIDCPEKGQEHGQQAKHLTSALVAGRTIEVKPMPPDRSGPSAGLVQVDGQSLNELLIQNGYAWVYWQTCREKFCTDWVKHEGVARNEKKGMWNDSAVVPPWEWRAAQRDTKPGAPPPEDSPPVILIGKQPEPISDESLLSKIGKAITPSSPAGNQSAINSGNQARFRCDGRIYCSQMTSCEEATFFLKNCPGTKMDGNNDGVPCEKQWCR